MKIDLVGGEQLYAFLKQGGCVSKSFDQLCKYFEEMHSPWFEVKSLEEYGLGANVLPSDYAVRECSLIDFLDSDGAKPELSGLTD